MKFLNILFLFSLFTLPSAMAIDLKKLASEPATIEGVGMDPVALKSGKEKEEWIEIPEWFQSNNAMVFRSEGHHNGVAEFRVVKDGYVLLACNFDYQGNESGGWTDTALSREEFLRMGWKELQKPKKIGGSLVQRDKRVQTIFFKKVYKGEYFKLRCNKYDPPYPILLGAPSEEKIGKRKG